MAFYTYILASQRNGTLYIGSTDSMSVRMSQHQQKMRQGFTAEYGVDILVWFEIHDTRAGAFKQERQMKKWNRAWKIALVERYNPGWRDLSPEFY
jgi:putative endonuclease